MDTNVNGEQDASLCTQQLIPKFEPFTKLAASTTHAITLSAPLQRRVRVHISYEEDTVGS
eukprot:2929682-Amphidinium_carterae.1